MPQVGPVKIEVTLDTTFAKKELEGLKRAFGGVASGLWGTTGGNFSPVVSAIGSNVRGQFDQSISAVSNSLVWQAGFGQMFRRTTAQQQAIEQTIRDTQGFAHTMTPEQRKVFFDFNLMQAERDQRSEEAIRSQFGAKAPEDLLQDLVDIGNKILDILGAKDVRNFFTAAGFKSDLDNAREAMGNWRFAISPWLW
jgi:hypothetical protein